MIVVRRATPDDLPTLFKFIQSAYNNRWQYKIPERWQWEYVDNPFLNGTDLPVWIAVDEDGAVVGQTCALVEPLKIGDGLYKLGWSVDTYLLPEYRGQGIGFQLQKANDEGNEIFMSLSMSNANRRIKSGLGSIPIDPVSIYTRLVRYEPESLRQAVAGRNPKRGRPLRKWLSDVLHWTFLDRAVAFVLNMMLKIRDLWQIRGADPNITMTQVDSFTEEIDRLWEKVSPAFYAIVKRDHIYLNWKYVKQPHIEYVRFIARKGDEIGGYLILRKGKLPERNLGIIADIFAAPDDEAMIHTLLGSAVSYLKKAGVKDILTASTIPAYQSNLIKLGFRKTREVFPMFHGKGATPAFKAALEPGSWFLGKGDHDWDQYPLAR